MRKVSVLLALFFLCGYLYSCGGGGSSSVSGTSDTTKVVINIGKAPALSSVKETAKTTASIPSSIYSITVTISGPGMETIVREIIVQGMDTLTETFYVPNGPDRHFLIEAKDAAGNIIYRGVADADMNGNPVILDIGMVFVGQEPPGPSPTPTPTPTPTPSDTVPPTFVGIDYASGVSTSEIRIAWRFPAADNVTASSNIVYLVYMSTTSGGENLSVPNFVTPPGAMSLIVTGLNQATRYCFIVRARDEAGNIDTNTVEQCASTSYPYTPHPSPTYYPSPSPMADLYPSGVSYDPTYQYFYGFNITNGGSLGSSNVRWFLKYKGMSSFYYEDCGTVPSLSAGSSVPAPLPTPPIYSVSDYYIIVNPNISAVCTGSLRAPESNYGNNVYCGGVSGTLSEFCLNPPALSDIASCFCG